MSLSTEQFVGGDALTRKSEHAEAHISASDLLSMAIVDGREWDKLIAEFDGVCQETTYVFAAARWPGTHLEPIVFYKGDEIVAGVLMMIQPLPLNLCSLAVAKWGPALKDESAADAGAVYHYAIDLLMGEYARKRGMVLSIMPKAEKQKPNRGYDYLVKCGFKPVSQLLFPDRYIVKLGLSDEEQRKSLAQKWRYHLKKSEKAGLSFERAGPERLGEFDVLYHAMSDRKRFPDHSAYDTVPKLMASPVDALRPELFFVRHEGEVVAGAVIFKAGNTAVYLYGATNERALPLQAGYFLHWHLIRWLRDNTRAEWYDLGGTDGFQGLHQFKKGMVGSQGVIEPVPPVLNYAFALRARVCGTLAFKGRDLAYGVMRWLNNLRSDTAHPDQER